MTREDFSVYAALMRQGYSARGHRGVPPRHERAFGILLAGHERADGHRPAVPAANQRRVAAPPEVDRALDVIRATGGCGPLRIAEIAGMRPWIAGEAVRKLEAAGRIRRTGRSTWVTA